MSKFNCIFLKQTYKLKYGDNVDVVSEVINWICAMIIAPIIFCAIIYIVTMVVAICIPNIGKVISWIIG